ncbi:MAG TPA: hypothetical protein VK907_04130, partial [Phnomibacter sp.]|nr:hypothetical protein [Phnomibacter sp.]
IGGGTASGSILGLSAVAPGDLELRGNYTRTSNGTLTHNNRAIFFTGPTNATINAPDPGPEVFPYIILNKTAATNTLTLNRPVSITGKLTLTRGRMITTDANILRLTNTTPDDANNGIEVNADPELDDTYVHGPLWRHTAVANGSYLLPVGNPNGPYRQYRPVVIRTKEATASQFYGDYRVAIPPFLAAPDINIGDFIAGIINREYWQVDRNPAQGGAKARITLQYLRPPTVNPEHWTPTGPEGSDNNVAVVKLYQQQNAGIVYNWYFTKGSADPSGQFEADMVRKWFDPGPITSFVLDTFSPFGIGHASYTVLPVRLLRFSALLQAGDGLLQWQIADAIDLHHFEVEHSTDGQRYTRLGVVGHHGGTSFSYRHRQLPPGTHYYRLRMVGKDGRQSLSRIELLQVGAPQTVIGGLLQNPVVGAQAILRVYSAKTQQAEATLIDISGRMLLRQKIQLQPGANQPTISLMVVPAGAYRLILRTEDGVEKVLPLMK